jgi:hypothetical protein
MLELCPKQFYSLRSMDWFKYPLDKIIYFVASIIPGFTVLVTIQLSSPRGFEWFFWIGFLGYKTKLTIIVLLAFIIGYSATTFVRSLIGGVFGAVQGASPVPFQPYHLHEVAPWRDPRWRSVLKNYLGAKARPDTELITPQLYDLRRQGLNLLPESQRPQALYELDTDRLQTQMNDGSWGAWYDHFHQLVLQPTERDWFFHLRWGLSINFEVAGLIILVGSAFLPALRHWWLMLPSICWVLLLAAEEYNDVRLYRDKWSTLSKQVKFLLESQPAVQGSLFQG